MNPKLENLLWEAGQTDKAYTKEEWNQIINALLEDFRLFIKRDFQIDSNTYFDISNSASPSFSVWIWSEEEAPHTQSNIWSAVMGGG